ncbi:MAG: photosystem II biogenesis protein Psp29 [Cyanobacteria bacterium]|nr:photosystem II biogenesis protein Psp29 [Cyanobacteriota bacterium]MDW8201101.1 photosystem II biogenesis protein Psp29 [Cyanobacteriota bacterium SKYGB_h_bin112]
MNTVRTVSDAKRTFYTLHTRPISSIYRRVIDELMVEMHLLSVNVDFSYDPIYGFGVVSAFDRFMQGYRPEADVASIFNALCRSVEGDPQVYRRDAEALGQWVIGKSFSDVVNSLLDPSLLEDTFLLREVLTRLKSQGRFKYSRLFAIGLYTLLELANPEFSKDENCQTEVFTKLCKELNLPLDKLKKDVSLYRSNLEKLAQAQQVMADILRADRKQKERRTSGQDKSVTSPTESTSDPAKLES